MLAAQYSEYTQKIWNADPFTTRHIFNLDCKAHEATSQALFSPYSSCKRAHKIKQITDLHACELHNNLESSVMENIRDLYLQTDLDRHSFLQTLQQHGLKNCDENTLHHISRSLPLFESVAFSPLSDYFAKDGTIYQGEAGNIIETVWESYKMLRNLQSQQEDTTNNAAVVHQVFQLQPVCQTTDNDTEKTDLVEESKQNDHDNEHDEIDTNEQQQKPKPMKPSLPKPKRKEISQEKLDRPNLINQQTVNTLRQFIQSHLQNDDAFFAYKDLLCLFDGNNVTLSAMNSTMHPKIVEHKLSFYTLLNAVMLRTMEHLVNTLTITYIMYSDVIHLYASITNSAGYSFGCRLDEQQLIFTIPRLFDRKWCNTDDIRFKQDAVLEEYRVNLVGHARPTVSILTQIQETVTAYKESMQGSAFEHDVDVNEVVHALRFDEASIVKKAYYVDGRNRSKFVRSLMARGIPGRLANELWNNLGGAQVVDFDVGLVDDDVDEQEDEDLEVEEEDDLDLDGLYDDLLAVFQARI